MNPRNYFNPRNIQPPPRSFHPSNPQFQNMISNVNMSRFSANEPARNRPIQPNYQAPRASGSQQMPMQRKRPLNPPEPPKFSDINREEQPQSSINPAYKSAIDEEIKKLEDKLKDHLRDPESHPFYEKEWQLFWNRKADELTKRGEDPSDYDFHDEWCEFFVDRIRELHDEEIKWKIEQVRRKFGVTKSDYPPSKKVRTKSVERIESKKDSDDDDYKHYDRPEHDRHESVSHRSMGFHASSSQGYEPPRQFDQNEFDTNNDPIPPWRMQGPPDMQMRRKTSRFDQPGPVEEFVDHPKFRQPSFDHREQFSGSPSKSFNLQGQNFQNQGMQPTNSGMMQNQPSSKYPMRQDGSSNNPRFMIDHNSIAKKKKATIEKLLNHMLPTIQLENVPLTMRIPEILDFFMGKLRGIVGCFRATDYVAKMTSKIVYIILMDEKEIEMMENLREIYMDGSYVRISSVKLMNGSAIMEPTIAEVPGAPQSLFLTNLEKRMTETTFYLRELAKLFESQFTITGIRICHNAKLKKSRNFGFANFINKASVDEFDGRGFKMFDYEVRCSRTLKIPLLIHIDHSDVLETDPVYWTNHLRGINLLNVDM
ncbi:uncharacterized protein [Chironomus tepperi]|uniref:uncharacterized protein n=1 Tax=Chironomus tepperi TaxID=113505 RepID=UPI00391FB2DB